jgi:integrase
MGRFTATSAARMPAGRFADGDGLYLEVKTIGGSRRSAGRYWLFRFVSDGEVRWKGLGAFPAVSLKMAREKARTWREQLYKGDDPFKPTVPIPTFAEAVDAFLAVNAKAWKNAKHLGQWRMTLGDAYCARLRKASVDTIETKDVLEVLSPIWHDKPPTAQRLRGRLEQVFDYAKSKGWRFGENPARWRGNLKGPLSNARREHKHFAAMHFDQVPGFVASLRESERVTARALEFLILTATRTSEVLHARWDEIDLDQATWTIPASRMKANREHVVPLSQSALNILQTAADWRTTGDYIFPGRAISAPLSPGAVLKLMESTEVTVHGFRSAFSDWAGERTSFQTEVIEFALAHAIPSRVRAAYRRYRSLEKRRELMNAWADHCAGVSNVVPLRTAS